MSTEPTIPATEVQQEPWVRLMGSPYFMDWLGEQRVSLGFSTYQTGKFFLIGRKADGTISGFERTFNHCMGMWASQNADTLWLSSRSQIWRFSQIPAHQDCYPGYDVAYLPNVAFTTGDLDVHDLIQEDNGRVVFVNTRFGCLATISERGSFRPVWKPPFLSALVPEDRCHLNGLAMRDGKARYVTAVSQSDVSDGWRDKRKDGGCIVDVEGNEVISTGLSMPHSPRWYRDQLWVLNSGTGEFGRIETASGKFEPIAFCPGYLRGMAFHGDFAILTLSKPRNLTFQGLHLDNALEKKHAEPQCGLQIVDLRTGQIAHWLRIDGSLVTELYDSIILPGVTRPMAYGFSNDEIEKILIIDDPIG